jgi:hypothetical protein
MAVPADQITTVGRPTYIVSRTLPLRAGDVDGRGARLGGDLHAWSARCRIRWCRAMRTDRTWPMERYRQSHAPKLFVKVSVAQPHGACITPVALNRVLQPAQQHNFHIVEDTYSHLAPGTRDPAVRAGPAAQPFTSSGFAKILAPGWRWASWPRH